MREGDMTREDLLRIDPLTLLADGLRGPDSVDETGLRGELAALGALALSEQVRLAREPLPALDLCLVALDRVRERVASGAAMDSADREELRRQVALQTTGQPVLARWLVALEGRITDRRDLDAAVRFLERARTVWLVNEELRRARPPRP